jgi:hypothetical protein
MQGNRKEGWVRSKPWGWRQYVSPKHWYLPISPHTVTMQKNNTDMSTETFIKILGDSIYKQKPNLINIISRLNRHHHA